MLTQKDISRKNCHPPTKIQAFLNEFPWVQQYADCAISQAYVSHIEPAILGYRRQEYDVGLFDEYLIWERILLLDENGAIVISENEEFTGRRKYGMLGWLFGGRKIYERITGEVGESTIALKVKKLGESAISVRFILSWYPRNRAVILYKTPKDITFPQWIEQQIQLEQNQFRTVSRTIDNMPAE
jgi:hypothetical protein